MRNGKYSFRVLNREKKWIPVGWNLEEALELRRKILGEEFSSGDQDPVEIFSRAKKGAVQRGIGFHLTVDDVNEMFRRQSNRCAVTQKPFNNTKPHGQRVRPWAASIDRIDALGEYTTSNCRLVCIFVNIGLNTYGDKMYSELLEHIVRRVVREELARNGVIFQP